jgi:hypothetical protein
VSKFFAPWSIARRFQNFPKNLPDVLVVLLRGDAETEIIDHILPFMLRQLVAKA